MKASRLVVLALAGAFALPTLAHAQPATNTTTPYSFSFVGTNNSGLSFGGALVGPYQAKVGAGSPFDIFCIDFDNHIASGNVWNARIVSFADIIGNVNGAGAAAANALGMPGGITMNQLNLAGYLVDKLQGAQSGWVAAHSELWKIFSSNSALNGVSLGTDLTNPAKGGASVLANYDMIIDEGAYTGKCSNSDGFSTGNCKQTFIVPGTVGPRIVTPEPGTYALMGAGMLALGFAGRRRRRKA